jgi:hypothetical protein
MTEGAELAASRECMAAAAHSTQMETSKTTVNATVGSQARGKQSMSRKASLILDCRTRFAGSQRRLSGCSSYRINYDARLGRACPGHPRLAGGEVPTGAAWIADKVLGWCGPSSFERSGSSDGEPIRNCPAGITTIFGHHGVTTTPNTVKSGSSRVSTLTPALPQRGPPGEGTSEFVAAIPLPAGEGGAKRG